MDACLPRPRRARNESVDYNGCNGIYLKVPPPENMIIVQAFHNSYALHFQLFDMDRYSSSPPGLESIDHLYSNSIIKRVSSNGPAIQQWTEDDEC